MASATIDIFVKFKEAENKVFSSLKTSLDRIADGFAKKMNQSLAVNVAMPTAQVKESVNEVKEIIEDGMAASAKKTEDAFLRTGNHIVNTGEERAARFTSGVTGSVGLLLTSILYKFRQSYMSIDAQLLSGPVKTVTLFFQNTLNPMKILGSMATSVIDRFKSMYGVASNIGSVLKSANGSVEYGLRLFGTLTLGLGQIFTTLSIGRLFISEALELFKRMLGMGKEALTPLQRASRLITTFDASLHSVQSRAGTLLKTATYGLASIFGPFAGIITGLATANSFVTLIMKTITKPFMQIGAFLGNSRSQLGLIITEVKDALYELVKVNPFKVFIGMRPKSLLMELVDALKLFAKTFVENQKNVATMGVALKQMGVTGKDAFGIFMKSKLPIGVQIQIIARDVMTMLKEIAISISTISRVIGSALGLSKKQIGDIKLGSIADIESISNTAGKASLKISEGLKLKTKDGGIFDGIKRWWTGQAKKESDLKGDLLKIGEIQPDVPAGILARIKQRFSAQAKAEASAMAEARKVMAGTEISSFFSPKKTVSPAGGKEVSEAKSKIQDLFSFDKIFERIVTGSSRVKFPPEIYQAIRRFVTSIETSLQREFKPEHFGKIFETFFKKISGNKVAVFPEKGKIDTAFLDFKKNLEDAVKKTGISAKPGEDIGATFMKSVSAGFKKGATPEAQSSVSNLLNSFKALLSSAAPSFGESGAKISKQLAEGMDKGKGVIGAAANREAEEIAKRFPRSPAEIGPLRTLVSSGYKIPLQLAQGIDSGMDSLFGVVDSLAEGIIKRLKPAIETGNLAARLGMKTQTLSLLEYALSGIGVSGNDLQFVFSSLNKTINEFASPEQMALLDQLGISLVSIRNSSDPLLGLFLSISDSLSRIPPQSELARKAFEAFGVTAGSNLALAFRKNKGELVSLMQEGAKLGTFWDDSFVEISKKVNSVWERIKKLRDFVFKEFLAAVLPVLDEISVGLFQFLKENTLKIRTATAQVGQLIEIVYSIVKKIFILATTDQEKAMEFIISSLYNLAQFVWVFIGNAFDTFWAKLKAFFGAVATGLWSILSPWISYLWKKIGIVSLSGIMDSVIRPMADAIYRFLKSIEQSMGPMAPAWAKKASEGMVQFFRSFKNDSKTALADNEKDFFQTVDAVEAKTKEAFTNIFKIGKEAFAPDQLKKFLEIIKFEWGLVIDEIKKSSAGTPLEEEIKRLEAAFSSGSFEKIKKTIEETSESTKKAVLGTVDTISESVRAGANAGDEAAERTKNAWREAYKTIYNDVRMHYLEVENVVLAANDRASQTLESKHMLELNAMDKQHAEEIKKLIDLNATKDQIDATRNAQFEEKARAEREYYVSLMDSVQSYVSTNAQTLGTMFDTLYALSKENVKEFFYMAKAAAIAEAIMNVAQGVTKAIAQGGIWGIAQGAIVAAAGTVQIAKIVSETIGFATGGQVPGHGVGDTVPAMLTPGEFVIPAPSVRKYGAKFFELFQEGSLPQDMFKNLAEGFYPRGYASGGIVQNAPMPPQRNSAQAQAGNSPTIINVPDPAIVENYLNTNKGKSVLVNVISNNSIQFRKAVFRD